MPDNCRLSEAMGVAIGGATLEPEQSGNETRRGRNWCRWIKAYRRDATGRDRWPIPPSMAAAL